MNKMNIKIFVVIILWIAAVFFIFRGISAPSRLSPIGLAQKGGLRVADSKTARGKSYIHPRKSRRSSVNVWGKSPFLPLKTEASKVVTESGDIELVGIMWDEKAPCAIINGRVVKVKDRLGNNEVIEIKKDRVILNDGKKLIELNIVSLKKND